MSEIYVYPFPLHENRELLRDSTVVVIDVLRATTTLIAGLQAGAHRIVPVAEPEMALRLKNEYLPEPVVLSGERNGLTIPGFDLGNSPWDFTAEKVGERNIIMCTTNGTKAINFASSAAHVVTGSFWNLSAVVSHLQACETRIVLVCSGQMGQFCMEDMACAGAIVDGLVSKGNNSWELKDSAQAAQLIYQKHAHDLSGLLKSCDHGRYLASLGMGSDLDYCAQVDVSDRVPVLMNGILQ